MTLFSSYNDRKDVCDDVWVEMKVIKYYTWASTSHLRNKTFLISFLKNVWNDLYNLQTLNLLRQFISCGNTMVLNIVFLSTCDITWITLIIFIIIIIIYKCHFKVQWKVNKVGKQCVGAIWR